MTQITLWLLPLVLGSLFGMTSAIKAGLRWSWGMCLQHGIVLLIALTGLVFLPKFDWLCAILGWVFLLFYTVLARLVLTKMGQALGLLRCEEAMSRARILKYILWGPPGQYWLDLAFMINFYMRGDTRSADAIYKKWQSFNLPRSIADSLTAYAMVGLLVMRDWQSTIDKFEETKLRYEKESRDRKKQERFPFQIAVPAVRAFSELERFSDAKNALLLADLPASNYGRDSIDTIFLSYFAVLGAEVEVQEVLQSMATSKSALPEHARLYWLARAQAQSNEFEKAILTFAESLRKTPEKDHAWRERTQYQLKLCQEKSQTETASHLPGESASLAEKMEAVETGRKVINQCNLIAEIMNSRKSPRAVRVMTGLLSIIFVCCFSPYLLGDKSYLAISNFAFNYGVLDGKLVMAGEWWRLISYQFLHGGLSHLFMNLFGLVWFGRFVENIFGSKRFLIIFFACGILSGLAQILVDPQGQAVGASGAILGVFGAGLAAMLRLKDVLPANLRKHELGWMFALAVTQLLFDQIVNLLFPAREGSHDAVRIAAAAHFGGMLSGLLLGWLLPLRKLGTEESGKINLQEESSPG